MTTPDAARLPDPADGADAKQHGDPLLSSAQEKGERDDGSRHGVDATGGADPADREA
jgi:hypothetical protein